VRGDAHRAAPSGGGALFDEVEHFQELAVLEEPLAPGDQHRAHVVGEVRQILLVIRHRSFLACGCELRTWCTMHVCTVAFGKAASIACAKPSEPVATDEQHVLDAAVAQLGQQ
jgi:hypothetical protein